MKSLIIILVCLFYYISAFSQKTKTHEYVGALTTSNKEIITYKINFEEENGKIDGISVTDFYGKDMTKAKIVGTIKNNKISFVEVKNISTKSSESESTFCFIQVKNIEIKTIKNKEIIIGDFIGKYSSGVNCVKGTIYLVSTNVLEDIKTYINTQNKNNDTIKKIDSLLNLIKPNTSELKILTNKNNKLNINWMGENEIVFDVWDGYIEDGDVVSIYFDGELIKKNLLIKNKKLTIKIPFKGNKGTLRILAINEGSEPLNTVNFMLKNGTNLNPLISKLNKGEEVTIEFNRN